MALKRCGFFPSIDGTLLYYSLEGQGPPLLFCYGLACKDTHWRHQLGYFKKRYTIITLDYRGHQRSASPANDQHLSLEWCAKDVEALLTYLQLNEVVGIGHRMGACVLAIAATKDQTRLKKVIFICAALSDPFEHMFFSNRMKTLFNYCTKLYENFPATFERSWRALTTQNKMTTFVTSILGFNPFLSHQKDVESYLEGANQTPFPVFLKLIQSYGDFNEEATLQRNPLPTLVIAGERDLITPMYVQEKASKTLPQGRMIVIPNGSHNAHTDQPELVNQAIDSFLTEDTR